MTMPVILGNAMGVVGNVLESGQGVPVYSVVGHPNLTQYVMAPKQFHNSINRWVVPKASIHSNLARVGMVPKATIHGNSVRIRVMPMAFIPDDNQAGILVVPAVAITDIKIHNEIQMVSEATIDHP